MLEDCPIDRARAIVAEVLELDVDLVGISSDIETLHDWNSIKHVSIIQTVEEQVRRSLTVEEIVGATNIEGIARVLKKRRPNTE